MAFPQSVKTKMDDLNKGPSNAMANQSGPPPDPTADPSMPDESAPTSGGGQSVLVPQSSIEMHGSTPEPGDPVEFSVTGTCTGKEGDNYRVSLEAANGKDLPMDDEGAGDDPSEDESTDSMETKLRGMYPSA